MVTEIPVDSADVLETQFYNWMKPFDIDLKLKCRSRFFAIYKCLDVIERNSFVMRLGAIPFRHRLEFIKFVADGDDANDALLNFLDEDENVQAILDMVCKTQARQWRKVFGPLKRADQVLTRYHSAFWVPWYYVIAGCLFGSVGIYVIVFLFNRP